MAFWIIAIGIQITYYGQFWEGFQGMPRRISNYAPIFANANLMSTIGAYTLMTGWLVFLYCIIHSWRHGEVAPANPWHAKSLEWMVPTPVPLENFLVDPVVTADPYGYGEPEPAVEPDREPEPAVAGSSSPEGGAS